MKMTGPQSRRDISLTIKTLMNYTVRKFGHVWNTLLHIKGISVKEHLLSKSMR